MAKNIRLMAIRDSDGWAFVTDRGTYYAVRPPYIGHNVELTSDDAIAKGIIEYGFKPVVEEEKIVCFSDWDSLFEFLAMRMMEIQGGAGQEQASIEEKRGFVIAMPRVWIEECIRYVDQVLVGSNKYELAHKALEILAESKAVQEIEDLRIRLCAVRSILLTRQNELKNLGMNKDETQYSDISPQKVTLDAINERANLLGRNVKGQS